MQRAQRKFPAVSEDNLPASVGPRDRSVNGYLISYIRHLFAVFLLDGKPAFMVKLLVMSSASSNQSSNNASGAGSGVAITASPTFSPLYQQIKALITQSLQSGEWKPGEVIPSEVELASRFKVSQGTVRKAIDEMSAENLVVRRQGKGTFVATHHEERAHYRFLRLMPDVGEARQPENRVVEVKRMRAPDEVARLLDIKSGDSVIFIRRVQSFDAVPIIHEELWLPGALFRGLTAKRLVEYKGPMYGLFETEFGTRMIRATERVRAVLAEAQVGALLEVKPGTPLLSLERVSFTYGDKPVEVRRGLYRTDTHHYHNELS